MRYKKRILSTLLVIGICLTGLLAQEATIAAGGIATGNGGSADYTFGQMVFSTQTGTNGSVTQGVQQTFDISIVSDLKELNGITLECSTYPNPTPGTITLKFDGELKLNYIAALYDINGKLIEKKQVENKETVIDLKTSTPATYILKISDNNKDLKTFKIVKTN